MNSYWGRMCYLASLTEIVLKLIVRPALGFRNRLKLSTVYLYLLVLSFKAHDNIVAISKSAFIVLNLDLSLRDGSLIVLICRLISTDFIP
jgi:hypothetical protein